MIGEKDADGDYSKERAEFKQRPHADVVAHKVLTKENGWWRTDVDVDVAIGVLDTLQIEEMWRRLMTPPFTFGLRNVRSYPSEWQRDLASIMVECLTIIPTLNAL